MDTIIILRERPNVKENRCRKGGEFDMTTLLLYVGAATVAAGFMKFVEALDAPKNRRERA